MYSQGDLVKTLRGRIMVDGDYVAQVNVVNQTLNLSTTSNEAGQFNIAVKEGDLLVFTAVNLITLRKYVNEEDFLSGSILVEAKYNSIALDEVVVKESSITAESLGIIPVGQKKYTQAERKLYTATSGGGIDGLLNSISGRKAMLKKVVVIEKKQAAYDRLIYLFEDDYYTDKLNISAEYISGFQYYCVEDDEFVAAIESKNKTLIKFLIVILAEKYKKVNTDESVN